MKITLHLDANQAALLCGTLERAAKQYSDSPNQRQLYDAIDTAVDNAERESDADLAVQMRMQTDGIGVK